MNKSMEFVFQNAISLGMTNIHAYECYVFQPFEDELAGHLDYSATIVNIILHQDYLLKRYTEGFVPK